MCCVLFFENSAKKITHVPCCAYVSKLCIKSCASIKQPDYPDHGPSLSGGGRQDKARRTTPKPSPKTQKRVLGHDRTARLPRPAPALSGGVGRTKTRRNTQNQPKRFRKRQNQSIRKTQTSEPRKTENYRVQRRCENQLSTAAPRDLSTLRWTPRANALAKCTCRHQELRTAPVEVV